MERIDYLEFVARIAYHIPDKGHVIVRSYSLYAYARRGKIRKASVETLHLRVVEQLRTKRSQGWAEMIRKVFKVDPMVCPHCGGRILLPFVPVTGTFLHVH